ncbi:MAG: hypothetical protein Q7S12_00120 [bacterium]|nr:hypothetical protein [bacterium]
MEDVFSELWMADLNCKLDSAKQNIADLVYLMPTKLGSKFGIFLENPQNLNLIPMNCYDKAHRLEMIKWNLGVHILVDASYRGQKNAALSCLQDSDSEYFKTDMDFVVEICVGYQTAYGLRVCVQNFRIDQNFIKNMQEMTFLSDNIIRESVVSFIKSISNNLGKVASNFLYDLVQSNYGPEAAWIIYKGYSMYRGFRQKEEEYCQKETECNESSAKLYDKDGCVPIINATRVNLLRIARGLKNTKSFAKSKAIKELREDLEKAEEDLHKLVLSIYKN